MSTTVIQARPTLYRGVLMRSRLEADYAAALDRCGYEWEYEPVCFAGPDAQWLPDFRIAQPGDPRWTFIELKAAGLWLRDQVDAEKVNTLLRKMSVAWLTSPDAHLELVFWSYGGPRAASIVGLHRCWAVGVPPWPLMPWIWGRSAWESGADPVEERARQDAADAEVLTRIAARAGRAQLALKSPDDPR